MEEVKLDALERRRNKERLAPFRVERLDYRNQDQEAFYQGLARNGPKAIEEYRRHLVKKDTLSPAYPQPPNLIHKKWT